MAAQDIYERLKEDHERHRQMIQEIKDSSGHPDERIKLFAEFKKDVMGHAAAEEETLYATMLSCSEIRQDAQHSTKEHAEIGMMLVKLDEKGADADGWLRQFEKLAEEYTHHVDEEESKIFPDAQKEIDEETAVRLRDEFNERKPEEVERAVEGKDLPEIKEGIKEEEGSK
jgi:hemerythrin superfamily protein